MAIKESNPLDERGMVLCPVCKKPSTWAAEEKGKRWVTKFVRFENESFKGLVHQHCIKKMSHEIVRRVG